MGKPRYFLYDTAVEHLREVANLGSEVGTRVLADLSEVAANPDTIGTPLDPSTLEAIREHFSQAEIDLLKVSRVFYGGANILKWVVVEAPHGKSAAFYSIKPNPGLNQEREVPQKPEPEEGKDPQEGKKNKSVTEWLMSPFWRSFQQG